MEIYLLKDTLNSYILETFWTDKAKAEDFLRRLKEKESRLFQHVEVISFKENII